MELAKYKACICEGAAENAVMDILLDADLLVFSREEMLEEAVIRCREGNKFEQKYLRKGFADKISVIRILDSRREKFKIGKAYEHKIDVINVITAPEIEMLIIFAENQYKEFKKSGKKPSDFCKENLRMPEVKSYDYVFNYFSDSQILVSAIKEYHRTARIPKGEYTLLEAAVSYYVSSNVSQEIKRVFENSPYYSVICDDNMLEKINTDKTIKANFYSLVARMETLDKGMASEETYKNYLQDLYWYNSGMFRKLNRVYALVEKAVMQWCNGDEEGNCCLEKRGGFSLYEKIEMVPKAENVPYLEEKEELQRFIPSITVAFEGKNEEKIKLDIDYSLYELLDKLNRGYIQTANDRNNHAEFISFINRILQTGSLDKTLTILSGNGTKASIAKRMFGYKFKVVK